MVFVKGTQSHTHFPSTYRTAIDHGADVGVVIVRHLFIVGAQEADGLVVVVLVLIVPGHRLVAVVCHVLPSCRTQQSQESHLDHTDGVALRVHVGELQRGTQMELSLKYVTPSEGTSVNDEWIEKGNILKTLKKIY